MNSGQEFNGRFPEACAIIYEHAVQAYVRAKEYEDVGDMRGRMVERIIAKAHIMAVKTLESQ